MRGSSSVSTSRTTFFEYQVFAHAIAAQMPMRMRRMARSRSLVVLAGFVIAMLVARFTPRVGFALICAALLLHLRPDVSGTGS
jgi:hypothetical protein